MHGKRDHLPQLRWEQHRWLILGFIILMLLLGSSLIYSFIVRKVPVPPLPDTVNFMLSHSITDSQDTVWRIAVSPDGELFVDYSGGNTIHLWRMDGSLVHTLNGGGRFAFSPDGTLLVAATQNREDAAIKVWRVRDGRLLQTLGRPNTWMESVAFNPNGHAFVSVGQQGITLWRTSDWTPTWSIQGAADAVRSVAFSPDGRTFATTNQTATVKLYAADSGTLLNTFEGQSWGDEGLAFSPDGQLLATATLDATIQLWHVRDGKLIHTFAGPRTVSLAFRFDGKILAAGHVDGTTTLWRVADGTLLQTLMGQSSGVNSVTFSLDGRTLLTGSGDGTIKLWHDDQ